MIQSVQPCCHEERPSSVIPNSLVPWVSGPVNAPHEGPGSWPIRACNQPTWSSRPRRGPQPWPPASATQWFPQPATT